MEHILGALILFRLTKIVRSNGGVYIGSFKDGLPHGKGKYTWFEGTIYDGDWEDGKMTGKGKIIWPSGAKYEGDISDGYRHGFGIYNSSDGSIYNGAWRMNIRHGFGRQLYTNLYVSHATVQDQNSVPSSDRMVFEREYMQGVLIQEKIKDYENLLHRSKEQKKTTVKGARKVSCVNFFECLRSYCLRLNLRLRIRLIKIVLSNGGVYIGNFKDGLRHGKGKYTWFDGTIYDGDWEDGKMTGKGKIICPSGAKYEGDISGGYRHGFGIYNSSDGSIYNGAWRMNIRHGSGRQLYANLDVYDGSWKEGMPDGCGRYFWSSGNSYIGNWKGGQMCGKGIMKWKNGDHFIGSWCNGFRYGSGVYHFADGAYYFGSWSRGLKDGKGTFYPAGIKPASLEMWHNFVGDDIDGKGFLSRTLSLNSEKEKAPKRGLKHSFLEKISITGMSSSDGLSNWPSLMDVNWGLSDPTREVLGDEDSRLMSHANVQDQNSVPYSDRMVYEREYMQGVLIQEKIKDYENLLHRSKEQKKTTVKGARKVSCVNFFERLRSYC